MSRSASQPWFGHAGYPPNLTIRGCISFKKNRFSLRNVFLIFGPLSNLTLLSLIPFTNSVKSCLFYQVTRQVIIQIRPHIIAKFIETTAIERYVIANG